VSNGPADAVGLNVMATPHNPAPTAAVMLTRSKIVIDVDPFIRALHALGLSQLMQVAGLA
jgi:hypothetical protein